MSTIYDVANVKGFIRMCNDGWLQGWHERNGGNLTYRMTEEDVAACRPFFDETPREWVNMGVQADNLAVPVGQLVAAAAQIAGRCALEQLNVHGTFQLVIQYADAALQQAGHAVHHAVHLTCTAALAAFINAGQAGIDD